jgi:hypothetical protein
MLTEHDVGRLQALLADVEWNPDEQRLIAAALAELRAARERAKPTAQSLFGFHQPPPDDDLALSFVIPTPPAAKNSRNVFRTGPTCPVCKKRSGQIVSAMNDDAEKAVKTIRMESIAALKRQAPHAFEAKAPLLPDEDVRLELVHHVASETCSVLVRRVAAKPKGVTGRRRDVVNLPEIVCDALQRVAFADDRQITQLQVWRDLGALPLPVTT